MVQCSYCHQVIRPTTGKLFVKNDGSRFNFCSSKCEKHWQKKRKLKYIFKPLKVKK